MSNSDDIWAAPPPEGTPDQPAGPPPIEPPPATDGPQPPTGYGQQPPPTPAGTTGYGYGAPAAGYGQPGTPYGSAPSYGYAPVAPKHPQATTAMVLGIVSLVGGVFCGAPLLAAPFAWFIGAKAVGQIDAAPQAYSGRDQAKAGQILGIIGTVLLIIGIVLVGLVIAVGVSTAEFSGDL
ncbi:MAG: hypothetical protein ACRCYU_13235 [Nocardioides sp.]